jgi:GNAT superfamily N-acetyltransferase
MADSVARDESARPGNMFPPGLAVRAVRPTDNEAIRALFISTQNELVSEETEPKIRIAQKKRVDGALNDDLLRASVYYSKPKRRMWVLESQEREIVALAAFDADGVAGGGGLLKRLAVDPRFRRKGVARLLVQRTEQWAVQHGVENIRLDVTDLQPAAKAMFLSVGYAESKASQDGPIGVFQMMKSLTTASQ